jgi:hypothetical protein
MSDKIRNLQELVSSKAITQSGADWLRTALDPFHDYAKDFEGYPDLVSTKSKVQLTCRSTTITTPTAGGAYSARVWVNNICSNAGGSFNDVRGVTAGGLDIDTTTSCGPNGLLIVESWNGGVNPNVDIPGANFTRSALQAKTSTTAGRLIALGFEVHNTTPVVNMAGTLTASTTPNVDLEWDRVVEDSVLPSDPNSMGLQQVVMPPTDSATALTVPGAVQWHSEKGAYVVAQLNKPTIPVDAASKRLYLYGDSYTSAVAVDATVGTNGAIYAVTENQDHSFSRPYVLLTGLSAESTFTVTMRAYIEYFPRPGETFMPFATASPAYDHYALELYGMVAAELPLAVPVNMNAKGDWFRLVMRAVSMAASAIAPLTAVIHPAAPAIATVAAQVAKILGTDWRQPSKKKSGAQRPSTAPKPPKQRRPKTMRRAGWDSLGGVPSSAR